MDPLALCLALLVGFAIGTFNRHFDRKQKRDDFVDGVIAAYAKLLMALIDQQNKCRELERKLLESECKCDVLDDCNRFLVRKGLDLSIRNVELTDALLLAPTPEDH